MKYDHPVHNYIREVCLRGRTYRSGGASVAPGPAPDSTERPWNEPQRDIAVPSQPLQLTLPGASPTLAPTTHDQAGVRPGPVASSPALGMGGGVGANWRGAGNGSIQGGADSRALLGGSGFPRPGRRRWGSRGQAVGRTNPLPRASVPVGSAAAAWFSVGQLPTSAEGVIHVRADKRGREPQEHVERPLKRSTVGGGGGRMDRPPPSSQLLTVSNGTSSGMPAADGDIKPSPYSSRRYQPFNRENRPTASAQKKALAATAASSSALSARLRQGGRARATAASATQVPSSDKRAPNRVGLPASVVIPARSVPSYTPIDRAAADVEVSTTDDQSGPPPVMSLSSLRQLPNGSQKVPTSAEKRAAAKPPSAAPRSSINSSKKVTTHL